MMKEIENIILSYKKSQQALKKSALATVVHVEGSSYRRPGARMLVTDDGQLTGAISGGCLEGDALRKALLAISQRQNKLVTYDTTDEEENALGVQLGCNGIVHILFEPIIPEQENNPIELLEKALMQTQASVITTLFSLNNPSLQHPGTCMLVTESKTYGNIKNEPLNASIENDITAVFKNKFSLIKNYPAGQKKSISAFIELLKPPVELIIAGAGNDVFPLLQMADILGWHVTIADGRKTHATAQRFAKAKKIIVGKPAEVVQQIKFTDESMFVLMSHNYNYDIDMLRQLIKNPCSYIGILGPKKKMEKMLGEFKKEGLNLTEKELNSIYSPVGLEIGAETSEEIALSIMAEIKAVIAGKKGRSLRDSKDFIHSRADTIVE